MAGGGEETTTTTTTIPTAGPPLAPVFGIPDDDTDDTVLGGIEPVNGVAGNDIFGPIPAPSVPAYLSSDVAIPARWSGERINDLQKQLVKGGWLNPNSILDFGVYDAPTSTAWRNLLTQSNRSGQNWVATLRRSSSSAAKQRLADRRADSAGGGGRAPTIRLSNPDDLEATFRQVSQVRSGGVWVEDDQIAAMVRAYQSEEANFQRQVLGGGTVTALPRADTFAATELEEIDPGGATANRFAQMAGVLEGIVGEARDR